MLYHRAFCDKYRELTLNDAEKTLLLDAAHDLEKAFLLNPSLSPLYRPVLGKCYYCLGKFHDAAEQYGFLLQTSGLSDVAKPAGALFASLTLCYRQAGESGRAKEVLERWAREFPNEKGVHMQLAEIEAQAGNYSGVVECLRKEMERNPAIDSDWKLSALLALGSTTDTSEAIREELKNNSDLWEPTDRLLQEYWLPFSWLDEKAREEWMCGALFPSLSDIPEALRRHKAAVACTSAVEIELRQRVFCQYREYALERPSLKQNADNGQRDQRSSRFCQFLVADGHLTLGEMATVLRRLIHGDEPVFSDFKMWLNRFHLRLKREVDNLDTVVAFRNSAVHENRTEAVPEDVIRCCRSILEALTASRS